MKAFILNRDRRLDFVERSLERSDAGGQWPRELDRLGDQPLVDHEARTPRDIAVFGCEEAHEGRARRINRRAAEKHQTPFRVKIGMETYILTHQTRDFGVAAQGGDFDHHQTLLRRGGQAILEMKIHAMVNHARKHDRGIFEILGAEHRRGHLHHNRLDMEWVWAALRMARGKAASCVYSFDWRAARQAVKNRS